LQSRPSLDILTGMSCGAGILLLALVSLTGPAAAAGPGGGELLAQVFEVSPAKKKEAAGQKQPLPAAAKKQQINSEEDLWREDTGKKTKGGRKKTGPTGDGEDVVEEEVSEEEVPEEEVPEEETPEEGSPADDWQEEGTDSGAADEGTGEQDQGPGSEPEPEYPTGPVMTGPNGEPLPVPAAAGQAGASAGKKTAGPVEKAAPPTVPEKTGTTVAGGQEPAGAGAGTIIRYPSGTPEDLESLWQRRLLHRSQHDFELARQDLEEFVALQRELDIGNMPAHALVLLRQAAAAEQAKDRQQARKLLQAALAVAPDLPRVHLRQAWYSFRDAPLKPGPVFHQLGRAISAAWSNRLWLNRFLVNLVVGVLLALVLAGGVFLAVQFVRYLRFFFHDFHHLFPRGVARIQSGLLAVLLLLLPLLFHLGLVAVLFVFALIGWLYQQRREQVLTMVVVLVLGISPFAVRWLAQGLQAPGSLSADLYAVARGSAPLESRQRLRSYLAAHPDDARVLAVLGGYYKRAGRYEQAERLLRRAHQARPSSELITNNLGNVLFLKRDVDGAIKLYDEAIRLQPATIEAYYNLSRAYYAKLDLEKAKEHRQAAARLGEKRVRRWQKQAASGLARFAVVDIAAPDDWLAAYLHPEDDKQVKRAAEVMWRSWGGLGSTGGFPFVAGGFVLLLLLLQVLKERWQLSLPCVRCGRPVCRRCDSDLPDRNSCGQCFHAFRQREGVDARARIEKEIQIRQRRRRLERLSRLFSFMVPGMGQLLVDKTIRGFTIMVFFSLALMQVLTKGGPMVDTNAVGVALNWSWIAVIGALALVAYTWALLSAFRQGS